MTAQPEALDILLRAHREMEDHLKQASGWVARVASDGATALEELWGVLEGFGRAVQQDLKLHIAHEDNALFPVLQTKIGPAGPVAVMLHEHRELERLTKQYHAGLAARNPREIVGGAQGIVQVLSQHIAKEENILFPLAQRVLSAAEWQEVLEQIQAQEIQAG